MVTMATEKMLHLMSANTVQQHCRHLNLIPPQRWRLGLEAGALAGLALEACCGKDGPGQRGSGSRGQARGEAAAQPQ